jgi:AraC-like DNA-binding protein
MAEIIGTAAERIDGELMPQVCRGTIAEDIRDRGFPFRILFVEHDGDFPMHAHEYAELVVVLGGQAEHRTEFESHRIERGDVFVITGARSHGFQEADGLQLCNVQFDPQWFFDSVGDLQEMMGFHGFFDLETRSPEGRSFRQRLRLEPAALTEIESLLRQVETEFHGDEGGRRTMISNLFLMVATRLSRIYEQDRSAQEPVIAVAVAAVAAFIRRNFRRGVRIEELAKTADLSVSQLQRSFKRFYGTTPIVMVNRLRVETACELLADQDRELSSIAEELGYSSASFFSTQFRQLMGMSPRDFRKQRLDVFQLLERVSVAPVGVGENGEG